MSDKDSAWLFGEMMRSLRRIQYGELTPEEMAKEMYRHSAVFDFWWGSSECDEALVTFGLARHCERHDQMVYQGDECDQCQGSGP